MWSTSSSSGCPVLRWPSPAWPSGCDWADTTSIRTWSDGDSREACRTSLDGTAPWRTAGGSSTMLGWRAPGFSPVAAARRRRRSSIRRHGSRWWSVTGERPAGSRRYRPHTGGVAADRSGSPAGRASGAGAPQAGRQPRSGVEGWARRVDYARGSRSPRAGGLRIADGQSVVLPGPGGGDRVLAGEVSTFPRTRRAGALHPAGARAPARHTLPPGDETRAAIARRGTPLRLDQLRVRNIIERATILSPGPTLRVELPASVDLQAAAMTLEVIERRHIVAVLDEVRWRIRGEGGAAQRLVLKPSTLESRKRKLGIKREAFASSVTPRHIGGNP